MKCKRCRREHAGKPNSGACLAFQLDRQMAKLDMVPVGHWASQVLARVGIACTSKRTSKGGRLGEPRHYGPAWAVEIANALLEAHGINKAALLMAEIKQDPEFALAAMRLGGAEVFTVDPA